MSGAGSKRGQNRPDFLNLLVRTNCGTAVQPHYSKAERICVPFKCCSVTPAFKRPKFIPASHEKRSEKTSTNTIRCPACGSIRTSKTKTFARVELIADYVDAR